MQSARSPARKAKAATSPAKGERPAGTRPKRGDNEDRRCLTTGAILPKEQMVRFVLGPDNAVVPDLEQNLPGRGLWVKADAAAIVEAAKKGLFAKAAKKTAKAAPDLAEQVQKLLRARCLNFIGLAKGAGIAVLGEEQVSLALRKGDLALLLLADDATSAKLDHRQTLPTFNLFSRGELGQALGYAQIVYAGLRPHGLTRRLAAETGRFNLLAAAPSQPAPKDG